MEPKTEERFYLDGVDVIRWLDENPDEVERLLEVLYRHFCRDCLRRLEVDKKDRCFCAAWG